jgi:diaminopimelate epimerase
MEITFEKMHGNGNDFILIDEYGKTIIPDEMKSRFALLYCDRRFGIGGDGVLYLSRSGSADLRMRVFQPDESEAPMCGNGIRCFVKHAFDAGYVEKTCTIETLAGIIHVEMGYVDDTFLATIQMPEPRFNRTDIPASGEGEYRETIQGYQVYAVNTGVPHAVIFVEDLESFPLAEVGPAIRRHASFPEGANVNIVKREGEDHISIRTFERGVEDETYSCGTGATASAAVSQHLGYTGTKVSVDTKGGPLVITLGEKTLLEGPAETVFKGSITF